MESAEVEVEHVGGGVHRPQRPVKRHRRAAVALRHALREHDLHGVARLDVALRLLHRGLERRLAEIGLRLAQRAAPLGHPIQGQAQRSRQLAQPLPRVLVRAFPGRVGEYDQVQPAGQVVDHRELLGQEQQHVRAAERVGLEPAAREPRLDPARRVVAEVAHESAAQPRQARQFRRLESREKTAHEFQRIDALGFFHDRVAVRDGDVAPHGAHRRARRQADERIAAEALAADHRFEQVGIGPVGQLEIDRQRGVEVGAGLEDDGDAVVAQRGKPLEFCFSHLLLHEKLSESRVRAASAARGCNGASCATSASYAIAPGSQKLRGT